MTWPGYYHVISRGVERRKVFLDDDDFEQFLGLLSSVKEQYSMDVHAFCLMNNHYHLLIETHIKNISEAMRYLNSQYSAWFNRKYKRSGHLWQGRYKSYYLYDEKHFWTVAKYIERNPLVAGMVTDVNAYRYQSLYQRIHSDKYVSLVEGSKIEEMTTMDYLEFVSYALDNKELDFVYKTPQVKFFQDGTVDVLDRRLNSFFETDDQLSRNEKVISAVNYGYTQTEVAQYLGLSAMAVSKIVKQ